MRLGCDIWGCNFLWCWSYLGFLTMKRIFTVFEAVRYWYQAQIVHAAVDFNPWWRGSLPVTDRILGNEMRRSRDVLENLHEVIDFVILIKTIGMGCRRVEIRQKNFAALRISLIFDETEEIACIGSLCGFRRFFVKNWLHHDFFVRKILRDVWSGLEFVCIRNVRRLAREYFKMTFRDIAGSTEKYCTRTWWLDCLVQTCLKTTFRSCWLWFLRQCREDIKGSGVFG